MASPSPGAKACSKCAGPFSGGGLHLAGVCSSCADGDSLCQNCVARHATDARFAGHACRALADVYAGADFLARLKLVSAPKACVRHGQPFLRVRCTECTPTSTTGFCATCVNQHADKHPSHVLSPLGVSASAVRAQLGALVGVSAVPSDRATAAGSASSSSTPPKAVKGRKGAPAPVSASVGTHSSGTAGAASPPAAVTTHASPLTESLRRIALATQAELDALAAHEEAALAQLDANRDAVMTALQECFGARVDAVRANVAEKRLGLASELEAADQALSDVTAMTSALAEAVTVLDDADIVQHAPALSERFAAAQAAAATIPQRPVTSSFLAIGPAPDPEALRATLVGQLGELAVNPIPQEEPPLPAGPADLSPEHAAWLQSNIPAGGSPSPIEWEEVFRATTHGFSGETFHERCDGRGRLLVLVRAREGNWLFGGFTAVGFSPPVRSYADPAAFLFSLTNSLGHPEKLESKRSGKEMFYHPSHSATFGSGGDLLVCDNADSNTESCTHPGRAFAVSASTGAHPMARGKQGGWHAAEIVAWVV